MPEKMPLKFESPAIEQAPSGKENFELEPLSEKEKEELDSLFKKLYDAKIDARKEIEWQIVEKFGERMVPFLLENSPKFQYSGDLKCFLDTVVTGKTALVVLEAIKKGEVGVWDGARSAAAGKEKTAPGLAEILAGLKLEGSRSPWIQLLGGLGEAGVDEVSPKIAQFYERLRKDMVYSERVSLHLKEYGNNLYSCDAHDVIRSLSLINGPKAREAIKHFASSGDEYIKKYAQESLENKLYIGHVYKEKIIKPISHPPEFYSTKSDYDFETRDEWEESLPPLSRPDETTRPALPEQLIAPSWEIGFLDKKQEFQEKHQQYLRDYFNGRLGAFEALGKLTGNEEIKNWQDFPEKKCGAALRAAVSLESLRVLLKAPDFKAMLEAADNLQSAYDKWLKENPAIEAKPELSHDLKRISLHLEGFLERVHSSKQEDFRLPESAGGFQLWHEGLKKARPVKPFAELLRGKLEDYFSQSFFETLKGNSSSDWVWAMTPYLSNLFKTYRDVENMDVAVYREAARRLEKVAKNKPLVFYGRDADYFYYAVKAQRFGLVGNKKPRKVYINTELSWKLKNPGVENRDRILAYLLQEKVSADALHIDTGFRGSVPEAVIKALNPKLKDKEVSDRIKLLRSNLKYRETLSKHGEGKVDTIEGREHEYGTIRDVVRDEKTGRLKIVYDKPYPWAEIEAWVINQAVIRNFAPRLGKNRRLPIGK